MTPCHTTSTGLKIGRAYIPPPQRVEGHAIKVQAALLEPRTLQPQTPLQRILGRVWQWL